MTARRAEAVGPSSGGSNSISASGAVGTAITAASASISASSVATLTSASDQRMRRAGEERWRASPSSPASASASRMLPPASVQLSKSPKVEADSSSTETPRSSTGWPLEIATRVRSSASCRGASSSAAIASPTLAAPAGGPGRIRSKAASRSASVTASSPIAVRRPYGVFFSTSGMSKRAASACITS
ncbi:MAG TPA: hypothetical protein VGC32_04130 [Solirubrobacterales bacterium]